MLGRQLEVLPPRLEVAFVRRRRRGVGHGGQRRRAALMRIRIAGRHGGRQREGGRRRETGSAARINGRADSARLRIAQIDGGRAQQAMDSAPEREGKRREEKVVSVSVSASESLEERREARGVSECNGAKLEVRRWRRSRGGASTSVDDCAKTRSECLVVSSLRGTRRFGGQRAGGRQSRRCEGQVAARCPDKGPET